MNWVEDETGCVNEEEMPRTNLNTCTETDPAACRYCGATPEMAAKLAALETEVAAWRALVAWLSSNGRHTLDLPVEVSEGEGPSRFVARAHRYGGTHQVGPYWYGEGATAGEAVVSLARQLKLIPEGK